MSNWDPYTNYAIVRQSCSCKEGCANSNPNLNESDITTAIQDALDGICFTDQELAEVESVAKTELAKIAASRDKAMADLQAKQKMILADIDYIAQNKITLLRTGTMDNDTMKEEQKKLEVRLAIVNEEIKAYAESVPEMIKYIMTFSELVKDAGMYFKYALDSERREITTFVFTELIFKDRQLIGYKAKDGFGALLKRRAPAGEEKYFPKIGENSQNGTTGSLGVKNYERLDGANYSPIQAYLSNKCFNF